MLLFHVRFYYQQYQYRSNFIDHYWLSSIFTHGIEFTSLVCVCIFLSSNDLSVLLKLVCCLWVNVCAHIISSNSEKNSSRECVWQTIVSRIRSVIHTCHFHSFIHSIRTSTWFWSQFLNENCYLKTVCVHKFHLNAR